MLPWAQHNWVFHKSFPIWSPGRFLSPTLWHKLIFMLSSPMIESRWSRRSWFLWIHTFECCAGKGLVEAIARSLTKEPTKNYVWRTYVKCNVDILSSLLPGKDPKKTQACSQNKNNGLFFSTSSQVITYHFHCSIPFNQKVPELENCVTKNAQKHCRQDSRYCVNRSSLQTKPLLHLMYVLEPWKLFRKPHTGCSKNTKCPAWGIV